ncbi:MAG: DUF1028 domain-containing protein [Spirochaetes bacterium]|nr:DUF1028 domain-containing protein [Spirochaetota bacterium]
MNKLVTTYSIIAVDSKHGEMGGAVQSHYFSVGSVVLWALPGAGVVATQAMVNPDLGPSGLKLLESGFAPEKVLKKILDNDAGRRLRQAAVINSSGESFAYTGKNCIAEAGHLTGKGYSVQANMMMRNTVWHAMERAFSAAEGRLAERLLSALEAAEGEGGDIRGRQSACIRIVSTEKKGEVFKDYPLDLRVEDNPEPLMEMRRLLNIHRAYEHAGSGDAALEKNNIEKALAEYSYAEKLDPKNNELKYWHGLALAGSGRVEDALDILREVYKNNSSWRELTRRVTEAGIIKINAETLKKII